MPQRSALIIVDVQNDFCAGGSLAVPDAESMIPKINELRETLKPDVIVLTQDWHPEDHSSFAPAGPWPPHCIQNTAGADFHSSLTRLPTDYIIQKGTKKEVDSYSGYGSVEERTQLESFLRKNDIVHVYIVGLAFDYCVAATAKDAIFYGFTATAIHDATRAVAAESAVKAEKEMLEAGVNILESYTREKIVEHNERVLVALTDETFVKDMMQKVADLMRAETVKYVEAHLIPYGEKFQTDKLTGKLDELCDKLASDLLVEEKPTLFEKVTQGAGKFMKKVGSVFVRK